jgi:hypothetical protein
MSEPLTYAAKSAAADSHIGVKPSAIHPAANAHAYPIKSMAPI